MDKKSSSSTHPFLPTNSNIQHREWQSMVEQSTMVKENIKKRLFCNGLCIKIPKHTYQMHALYPVVNNNRWTSSVYKHLSVPHRFLSVSLPSESWSQYSAGNNGTCTAIFSTAPWGVSTLALAKYYVIKTGCVTFVVIEVWCSRWSFMLAQ
jgi:hypothetical protein